MSDSIRTLTVLLKGDVDEHEIDRILTALAMVKGVKDVVTGAPNDINSFTARRVAHGEIEERLRKSLAMDRNDASWYYDLVEKGK